MNLLIIENLDCANFFLNKKLDGIFLTFDNLSYEVLKSKKKKVIFPSEVLDEKIFIKKFNYDKQINKIITILNKKLFKDYLFYKLKNWRIFNYFYIELKKKLDFPIYVKEVLNILIKKNNINNVFIIESHFYNLQHVLDNTFHNKVNLKKFKRKNNINKKNELTINLRNIIINKIKEYYFIFKNKNKNFLFINFSKHDLLKYYFSPDFLNINFSVRDHIEINDMQYSEDAQNIINHVCAKWLLHKL